MTEPTIIDASPGEVPAHAYCAGEFAEARMLRPDREQRREIVAAMRDEGMSTRAIGSAIGVGQGTVRRDLDSAAPSGAPEPDPEPDIVEAEIVDEPKTGGGATVDPVADAAVIAGRLEVGALRGRRVAADAA